MTTSVTATAATLTNVPTAPAELTSEGAVLTANGSVPSGGNTDFAQLLGLISTPVETVDAVLPIPSDGECGADLPEVCTVDAAGVGPKPAGDGPTWDFQKPSGEQGEIPRNVPVEQNPIALLVPSGSAALGHTAPDYASAATNLLRTLGQPETVHAVKTSGSAALLHTAPDFSSGAKDLLRTLGQPETVHDVKITAPMIALSHPDSCDDAGSEPAPKGQTAIASEVMALRPLAAQVVQTHAAKGASDRDVTAIAPVAETRAITNESLLNAGTVEAGHLPTSAIEVGLLPRPGPGATGDIEAADLSVGQTSEQAISHHLDLAHQTEWLDQLATDIARTGGKDGVLRFRLHPESLGSLEVEVSQGAAGTTVRLNTETEAARAILVDAQPRLLAEARAQGARIAEAHIGIGADGHSAPGEHRDRRHGDEGAFLRTSVGAPDPSMNSPSSRDKAERYA